MSKYQKRTIFAGSRKGLNAFPKDVLDKILIDISARTHMDTDVIFTLLANGWTYHEDIEGVSWTKKAS